MKEGGRGLVVFRVSACFVSFLLCRSSDATSRSASASCSLFVSASHRRRRGESHGEKGKRKNKAESKDGKSGQFFFLFSIPRAHSRERRIATQPLLTLLGGGYGRTLKSTATPGTRSKRRARQALNQTHEKKPEKKSAKCNATTKQGWPWTFFTRPPPQLHSPPSRPSRNFQHTTLPSPLSLRTHAITRSTSPSSVPLRREASLRAPPFQQLTIKAGGGGLEEATGGEGEDFERGATTAGAGGRDRDREEERLAGVEEAMCPARAETRRKKGENTRTSSDCPPDVVRSSVCFFFFF